jgi:hypothetical protein
MIRFLGRRKIVVQLAAGAAQRCTVCACDAAGGSTSDKCRNPIYLTDRSVSVTYNSDIDKKK